MSQVKPGPKREEAVATKVSRSDSIEEKSFLRCARNCSEHISSGGWGFGACTGEYVNQLIGGVL